MSVTSEGGEATVLGTLQNKSLRTRYSARTDTIAIIIQQFDAPSLRLYYGANAPTLPNGLIGVPTDPIPTVCAWTGIYIDGENIFALYAPKAEIYRNDDFAAADTESLAGLPIGVKPLVHGTNTWTYAITPLGTIDMVEATIATAGSPGTYSPPGAIPPADLAELRAEVTAAPVTAWTTGQRVVLGDQSDAHWDGDSWESGQAG
ncbi:hypothetical protein ACFFGN_02015 [Kribbella deserti]|uniref:Uncharacterized protein n=1 Tax=Kribbella deserti TaxID=1926257 RepID=A0ABV6QDX5_9ACTN